MPDSDEGPVVIRMDGFLVGGWTKPFENISQIGNLPQIGVNITNIWNHHRVLIRMVVLVDFFLIIGDPMEIGFCPGSQGGVSSLSGDSPKSSLFGSPNLTYNLMASWTWICWFCFFGWMGFFTCQSDVTYGHPTLKKIGNPYQIGILWHKYRPLTILPNGCAKWICLTTVRVQS